MVKKTAGARRQLRFPHTGICGVVPRLGARLKRCSRALAREGNVAPELPWFDTRASLRKPDPDLGQCHGVRPGPESARHSRVQRSRKQGLGRKEGLQSPRRAHGGNELPLAMHRGHNSSRACRPVLDRQLEEVEDKTAVPHLEFQTATRPPSCGPTALALEALNTPRAVSWKIQRFQSASPEAGGRAEPTPPVGSPEAGARYATSARSTRVLRRARNDVTAATSPDPPIRMHVVHARGNSDEAPEDLRASKSGKAYGQRQRSARCRSYECFACNRGEVE